MSLTENHPPLEGVELEAAHAPDRAHVFLSTRPSKVLKHNVGWCNILAEYAQCGEADRLNEYAVGMDTFGDPPSYVLINKLHFPFSVTSSIFGKWIVQSSSRNTYFI